jgi:hypothetical protein
MQTRQNNGRARPSRPSRDPDWRPSEPAADGFFPAPLLSCRRCAALLPASERAQQIHRRFHEQVDAGDPR